MARSQGRPQDFSQKGVRFFRSKIFSGIRNKSEKKDQNSRKNGTKLKKKEQTSRKRSKAQEKKYKILSADTSSGDHYAFFRLISSVVIHLYVQVCWETKSKLFPRTMLFRPCVPSLSLVQV